MVFHEDCFVIESPIIERLLKRQYVNWNMMKAFMMHFFLTKSIQGQIGAMELGFEPTFLRI